MQYQDQLLPAVLICIFGGTAAAGAWTSLFGTFKDTDGFAGRCGFPGRQEEKLRDMFRFRDVYR